MTRTHPEARPTRLVVLSARATHSARLLLLAMHGDQCVGGWQWRHLRRRRDSQGLTLSEYPKNATPRGPNEARHCRLFVYGGHDTVQVLIPNRRRISMSSEVPGRGYTGSPERLASIHRPRYSLVPSTSSNRVLLARPRPPRGIAFLPASSDPHASTRIALFTAPGVSTASRSTGRMAHVTGPRIQIRSTTPSTKVGWAVLGEHARET